ncbi:MAG: hypothetical protein ABSB29_01205 [Nitrososphaerales archaeon]|jgi:hypothetical protein
MGPRRSGRPPGGVALVLVGPTGVYSGALATETLAVFFAVWTGLVRRNSWMLAFMK